MSNPKPTTEQQEFAKTLIDSILGRGYAVLRPIQTQEIAKLVIERDVAMLNEFGQNTMRLKRIQEIIEIRAIKSMDFLKSINEP